MVKSRKKSAIVLGIIGLLLVVAVVALWPMKKKTLTTEKTAIGASTADELLESKELGEDSDIIEEYVKPEDTTETEEEQVNFVQKPASEKEDTAGDDAGSGNNSEGNIGSNNNGNAEDDTNDKIQDSSFEIADDKDEGYGKID